MTFARSRAFAAAFALGFAPVPAMGCGICIEDKVATAYDHALASRAIASGRVVVFAEVTGQGDAHARVRSARAAAAKVPGVEGASIRSNDAPAVLSFVLDTRAGSPEAALALAQGSAGRERFQLALLKVLR
jgi:hypothetical protein